MSWSSSAALHTAEMRKRLVRVALLLHLVLAFGTVGYFALGDGQWGLLDCLYMTIITITTVGYGEVLPLDGVAGARTFTIGIIIVGMGTVLYFASTLTAFFVEGSLGSLYGQRKMLKTLRTIEGHTIVCGVGRTGRHVVEELVRIGRRCVVLDQNAERVERFLESLGKDVPAVVGDATQDEDLIKAGVKRAEALVVALTQEVDTLYCTLSARQLNPGIRIIVTSDNLKAEQKFKHAGANSVLYTAIIGGRRIASEIVRPEVVTFLDLITSDPARTLRFEQITIPEGCALCGRSLATSGIRKVGDVLVVAIREPGDVRFRVNPGPDREIKAGDLLIVLGDTREIDKVRAYITGETATHA